MANWEYTLDITEEFKSCKAKEITIKELVVSIVEKLKGFNIKNDFELDDIIWEFENLIKSANKIQVDEFDEVLEMLYDWGDQRIDDCDVWNLGSKKMCWIATSF